MELAAARRRRPDDGRSAWAGLTLGAVLRNDKNIDSPAQVSRTLLDIIRDEDPTSSAYENLIDNHNNKNNWKHLKDRLRLRRATNIWTSPVLSPQSETAVPVQNSRSVFSRSTSTRLSVSGVLNAGQTADDSLQQPVPEHSAQTYRPQISRQFSTRLLQSPSESNQLTPVIDPVPVSSQELRRHSSRHLSFTNQTRQSDPYNDNESTAQSVRLSAALAAEREQIHRVVSSSELIAEFEPEITDSEEIVTETAVGQPPVRISLMELLEETDRQMGWVSHVADADEEDEEEDCVDDHDHGKGGGTEYTCCVCMLRHKGAAFIPCGHTFCRLCSRELWVSRGNCPLCNGFILEILDIF